MNQGVTKLLAFAVLACCAGMGLCASLLAFTWATGDLPFGLRPLIGPERQEAAEEAAVDKEWKQTDKERYGELYASRLYAALRREREELAARSKQIEERERELREFEKAADLLAAKLEAAAERASKLLEYTDETERANVQRLSAILGATDAAAGPTLLLELPPATAARLLQAMDARKAAEMMGALANAKGGAAKNTGAKEILAQFQKLSPRPPPELAQGKTP